MSRNAIESEFRTYKMVDRSGMQSIGIFEHPKWPTAAILSKIPNKNKVAYRSEMAIESEFRTIKMANVSHFVKIKKKVVYRSEMARNEIESDFRTSKMGAGSHFVTN